MVSGLSVSVCVVVHLLIAKSRNHKTDGVADYLVYFIVILVSWLGLPSFYFSRCLYCHGVNHLYLYIKVK